MNLLERIKNSTRAQRATAESIPTNKEDSSFGASSADDEDMFCLTDSAPRPNLPLGQQSYPVPDRALFLAIYEAALRRPRFFDIQNFCEYKKWLLGDSCYVLNTFRAVDANQLLALYLKYLPPSCVGALYPLGSLLWDIDLKVPEDYQRDFEQIIIDEGNRMTKNFS